ncbi:MAG: ABC transporter ATP-binding protein [Clostridiales bacterium]|nr:ABC transporter ATP-binding protein [Clostridiales bacterium]
MLKLRNLKVIFPNAMGIVKAVEGIDLDIHKGECVALVGESGCGKSVTSLAVMKLLNTPPALISVDEQVIDGVELKDYSNKKMQSVRGKDISLIFQDAMSALNPVMTVGKQIQEVFMTQPGMTKALAKEKSIEALELVGIPEPQRRYNDFPHQLSGGMRQRVLIAMAFACQPKLIIADEPTTALDVTVQAQVLEVLSKMQRSNNTSLLLITHDLSVVANMADTIYVMYCGKIVEQSPAYELFKKPYHPYTKGLLGAIPKLSDERHVFIQIPDSVPNPMNKPKGCYFHPRCPHATEQCRQSMPPLREISKGRKVRCFHCMEECEK